MDICQIGSKRSLKMGFDAPFDASTVWVCSNFVSGCLAWQTQKSRIFDDLMKGATDALEDRGKYSALTKTKERFVMAYEKIQSKFAYEDFTITGDDIDETFEALNSTHHSTGNWVLGLVNLTDKCYVLASIADHGGIYGKWFRIPRICKNCDTNFDDGVEKNEWDAILSLPDKAPSFGIRIATQPNDFGIATGTEFLGITPKSEFEGGIIGFD